MTPTDFPLINDPPSDAPNRRSSKECQKVRQQNTIKNHQVPQKNNETKKHTPHDADLKNQEEQQFILLLLKRDPHTWRDFVNRYDKLIISRILSTCRELGIVPRPDLIEDCGAEVMAVLFHGDMHGLRQFQGRSKLSTWLAVIVRRTALNFLHRHQRDTEKICPNDSQFDIATVPEKPLKDTAAIDSDNRTQIQNCMNQLNPSDRQALELYFDQNMSYADIGRALGITENAVGPKLHRAQKRLKKLVNRRSKPT